ncbi:MAG: prolipoprotein diacylglyceryl transferase [Elusimicrobiaceae bacterium]|nr:prolipoprotein diacylglyceryl transferase [Elusimicrobiaceae bacterium]
MFPYLPEIFGIKIPSYGLMTALGYGLAIYYCVKNRKYLSVSKEVLSDIIFYLILGALIGGKIFYIFFNFDSFCASTLIEKIRFGFVFYGGFIGAVLALFLYTKNKKIPFVKATDFFAPALALGHAIGRIGCFLAGCCYGKPTHSFLGVMFNNPDTLVPHHLQHTHLYPTQLFESFANFVLFFILAKIYKKQDNTGKTSLTYIMGYALIRFIIEFFRGDDRGGTLLGMYPSQIIALILFLGATFWLFKGFLWKNKH